MPVVKLSDKNRGQTNNSYTPVKNINSALRGNCLILNKNFYPLKNIEVNCKKKKDGDEETGVQFVNSLIKKVRDLNVKVPISRFLSFQKRFCHGVDWCDLAKIRSKKV